MAVGPVGKNSCKVVRIVLDTSTAKDQQQSKVSGGQEKKCSLKKGGKSVGKSNGSVSSGSITPKCLISETLPRNGSRATSLKLDKNGSNLKGKENPASGSNDAMNRVESLQKQEQRKASRARKLNNVAKSQLSETLTSIEYLYEKQRKETRRATRAIEDEIERMKEEERNSSQPLLPPVTKPNTPPPMPTPSPLRLHKKDTTESPAGCVSCRFNKNKHCRYFPCYLPLSYHCMGHQSSEKSFTILSTYDDLLSRCADARPPSHVRAQMAAQEARDRENSTFSKHQRASVKDKERGLKIIIQHMKSRNYEKNKPREWVTNYGAPLPRRLLLKPVIPVSESLVDVQRTK
ncbi:hypothetical protein FSP39_024153 [Pinctada imbricata]|uniref:Uncharacterized protein n=1 Tax=Pinctada imbricata TaxID=66713 RepID=A0AA88XY83_PINIB|nr:hypothetical protein FSP39_024153 [Pinctada imbricata]